MIRKKIITLKMGNSVSEPRLIYQNEIYYFEFKKQYLEDRSNIGNYSPEFGQIVVWEALKRDDIEIFTFIVEHFPDSVAEVPPPRHLRSGTNLLKHCCRHKKKDFIAALMKYSPIHHSLENHMVYELAVNENWSDIIQILMEKEDFDPSVLGSDLLEDLASKGRVKILKIVAPSPKFKSLKPALLKAIEYMRSAEMVKFLEADPRSRI